VTLLDEVRYDTDMARSLLTIALLLGACGHSATARDAGPDGDPQDASTDALIGYATTFDRTESPISENGAWTHTGLDWALVATGSGNAFGTQTGTGGYDDSYAHLSGFPANQSASGVIHRDATIDASCTHEVEILMRWSDSAHDAHGYECNLAFDGSYAQIVRWNGPFGSFTYIGSGSVPGGVHDGDMLSATAIGDVITLYVNGVEIAHATDATFPTGNPGMAFWRGGACGTRGDYGFTSYMATPVGP
jgi:hypothetical protein